MNLMLNGIEAMNDTGGVLTVKSEPREGQVVVSISDTGVGLPAGKADRIFDAFYHKIAGQRHGAGDQPLYH